MLGRADTNRSVIQGPWLFLGALDQILDCGDAKLVARRNHDGKAGERRDQDKVLLRIEAQLLIEREIGGHRTGGRAYQRVPIGSSPRGQRGAEIAAGAWLVFYNDRPSKDGRHLVEEHPA